VIAPMVADLTFYQAVPGLIDALPDDARDRAGKMLMGGADATVARRDLVRLELQANATYMQSSTRIKRICI